MMSLKGYVIATYDQLVATLGEPDYVSDGPDNTAAECYGDDKVETEWEFISGEVGRVSIYDWKQYDGGRTSRNGETYRWHIGGTSSFAVDELIDLGLEARYVTR